MGLSIRVCTSDEYVYISSVRATCDALFACVTVVAIVMQYFQYMIYSDLELTFEVLGTKNECFNGGRGAIYQPRIGIYRDIFGI